MPFAFIPPMLAVLGKKPPQGPEFLYEIKWDGYRCIALVDNTQKQVQLWSRNRKSLNQSFPELLSLGRHVQAAKAILDGEVVAFVDGKPSFAHLQKRTGFGKAPRALPAALQAPGLIPEVSRPVQLAYVAFDLLALADCELLAMPLVERRRRLADILKPGPTCLLSAELSIGGAEALAAVAQQGLEGIIAKQKQSPYLPGKRSLYWQKFKPEKVLEVQIGGFLTRSPKPQLVSILLGLPLNHALFYLGNVGTGLSGAEAQSLRQRLATLTCPTSPFIQPLRFPGFEVHWVAPRLKARVAYLELTSAGRLRHPVWRGLVD